MVHNQSLLSMLSEASLCARDSNSLTRAVLENTTYGFPWFTAEERARIDAYYDKMVAKYGHQVEFDYEYTLQNNSSAYENWWQDRKSEYDAEVTAGGRPRSHWPGNYNDE